MPKRVKKSAIDLRKKKEFTLHGRSVAELSTMTIADLAKILPARQRRTITRGFNADQQRLIDHVSDPKAKQPIRTHCRDVLVLPVFVGKRLAIFSGKEFKEVEIRPEMIGHYLGEFCMTRRFEKHSGPGVGATRSSKFMPLK